MAIFNPRQAVRKLRDRNFDEPQANAIVEVAEEVAQAADQALDEATTTLVTKDYFDSRLRAEFAELRIEMQKQRAEFYRIFAGLAGFIIAVAGGALAIARWLV